MSSASRQSPNGASGERARKKTSPEKSSNSVTSAGDFGWCAVPKLTLPPANFSSGAVLPIRTLPAGFRRLYPGLILPARSEGSFQAFCCYYGDCDQRVGFHAAKEMR